MSTAPNLKPKGVLKIIAPPKGIFEKVSPDINPKFELKPIE